ncbi:hypothetical protein BDR22DRAFT_864768 [Usnea florida]
MKMRGMQILSVALVLLLGPGLAVPVGMTELSRLETRRQPGCAGSGESGRDEGEKGFESPPPCFWGRDASPKADELG